MQVWIYYYKTEFLDSAVEYLEDDTILHTFFCDHPAPDGNHLIVITFLDDKNTTIVNSGFLDFDMVKISKKPTLLSVDIHKNETNETRRYLAEKDSLFCIVDPINHCPIESYTVYNEITEREETYIDIAPYRKYFAFQVMNKSKQKADSLQIGYAYYSGQYGLCKNWLLAAEWLMQSKEPEAAYYLGVIFLKDPLLRDTDLAKYYIEKAISGQVNGADSLLQELCEE